MNIAVAIRLMPNAGDELEVDDQRRPTSIASSSRW